MKNRNAIQKLLDAGLSRGEIAMAVGCTRACVSHWETGRSVPGGENMKALVRLATAVSVVLLASDFGASGAEAVRKKAA